MTDDWIRLEEFVERQVEAALAEVDQFIAEHDGEERDAMLRQRPKVARQVEAMVRLAYLQEPKPVSDAAPEYPEALNDPDALRRNREHLRRMLHKARTERERAMWRDRLRQVHHELARQEQR